MKHLEDAEQVAVMQWAALWKPPHETEPLSEWLIAIPNGGARNAREAGRLKAGGVKAGVSDLLLAYVSPYGVPGLWIEMKKRFSDFSSPSKARAAISDSQVAWHIRMDEQKYATAVCYGADEAIETIKGYLYGFEND